MTSDERRSFISDEDAYVIRQLIDVESPIMSSTARTCITWRA